MRHLTSTGAEAGRTRVLLDLVFHKRRGESEGRGGPAFSAVPATDVCGHLSTSLRCSTGRTDLDQTLGVFSLLGLCAGGTPMPCLSLWLAAGSQTRVVLQDSGMAQVTLDLSLFGYVCPCPSTMAPGALPFQSFLAQRSYCGVLCIWVGFFQICCLCLQLLRTGTCTGGPQSSLLCDRPWAALFPLHACRRCSLFERVSARNR